MGLTGSSIKRHFSYSKSCASTWTAQVFKRFQLQTGRNLLNVLLQMFEFRFALTEARRRLQAFRSSHAYAGIWDLFILGDLKTFPQRFQNDSALMAAPLIGLASLAAELHALPEAALCFPKTFQRLRISQEFNGGLSGQYAAAS